MVNHHIAQLGTPTNQSTLTHQAPRKGCIGLHNGPIEQG